MNKSYRLIWNAAKEAWVVAAETVKNRGSMPSFVVGSAILMAAVLCGALPASALDPGALPTGGAITAGSGSISVSGSQMTINQQTQQMIANWNSFNIGANAGVRFNQPGSTASALNRINDQNPTQIMGSLSANGRVFLINPSGIVFGQTARVDVGGLVASSLNMLDSDFMAGRYRFSNSGAAGPVINQGLINAMPGGVVALIAPVVQNEGTINAPGGAAAMIAANQVDVDFTGDGLINYTVSQGAVDALAENKGLIKADGGMVVMTARAASSLTTAVVNNSGIIEAKGLINRGGAIILEAGDGATTETGSIINTGSLDASNSSGAGGRVDLNAGRFISQTGSISANGDSGGQIDIQTRNLLDAGQTSATGQSAGGSITIQASGRVLQTTAAELDVSSSNGSGGNIRLTGGETAWLSGTMNASGSSGGDISVTATSLTLAGATLDASGQTAGGCVRIGGGWQGNDSDLTNAITTDVVASTIDVSAKVSGNAGTAVVWSEEQTRFDSHILAQGGVLGGDGGQVEVSSHGLLAFGGLVEANASNGNNGHLLLDPKNIEIVDSAGGGGVNVLNLADPDPSAGENFGLNGAVELMNGNIAMNRIAVASSKDDFAADNAGAVYLYNSQTGALIATLTGSNANDQVGSAGVTALANGNYVVRANLWNGGTAATALGAVTWGNGTTGVSGVISAANSLVGSTAGDFNGSNFYALSSGNYVFNLPSWDNGGATNAGAVVWGNGSTGTAGVISAANALVGSTASDAVGGMLTILPNGNYVTYTQNWDNGAVTNAGAATWGSGTAGITGAVSAANSLVGSNTSDRVGTSITILSNSNYVVRSQLWMSNGVDGNAWGAATWGSGTAGVTGVVSAANSIVGSANAHQVALGGITALTNGNYVVRSNNWSNGGIANIGAVTWGNGNNGTVGVVSAANSLVGSTVGDQIGGNAVVALTNGNYVVCSQNWDNGATANVGAVTWGNGATGTVGAVSAANSLVGSTANDRVGSSGATALTNGNYVVVSTNWSNGGVANIGAVTWGNGATGTVGAVSAANSLVGSTDGDNVGNFGIKALSNGNYVAISTTWDNGAVANAGAFTWGNGLGGTVGAISAANSMVGSTANDLTNTYQSNITELTNGNYVVLSPKWDNGAAVDAGALTWGSGTGPTAGVISAANALVGSTSNDMATFPLVRALSNGNYVLGSRDWDNGAIVNAGSVTWGNGATGTFGVISAANSLVGSTAGDQIGSTGVTALSNGNYLVGSTGWDNGVVVNAGALTWANGATGITGTISAANSLVGTTASDGVGAHAAFTNGNYAALTPSWNNGAISAVGALTLGNGTTGTTGPVSTSNSFVGTSANDSVGNTAALLSDGRVLVRSYAWNQTTPIPLASAGRVDIISPAAGGGDSLPQTFATNPAANSTLTVATLKAQLDAGTAVILQANNDITVTNDLTVNNTGGNGGALTLQAGRSILLNANLTTDNGNLTLIANETAANGVVDANRDAGAANITMAAGTSINAGSGSVSIQLKDGAGLTNNTAGTITLASITSNSLTVDAANLSGSITANNKVYDGNNTATLSAFSLPQLAFQSGSNLSLSSSATFSDANVATGKTVTGTFAVTGFNGAATSTVLKNGSTLNATTTADITAAPEPTPTPAQPLPQPPVNVPPAPPVSPLPPSPGTPPPPVITTEIPTGGTGGNASPGTAGTGSSTRASGSSTGAGERGNPSGAATDMAGGISSPFATASGISVQMVSQATAQGIDGIIAVKVPKDLTKQGALFNIPLPEEIKTEVKTGAITEKITLLEGGQLPGWLRYQTASKSFVVSDAPTDALPIKVLIMVGNLRWIMEISKQAEN